MAKNTTQFFTQSPNVSGGTMATSKTVLFTAGANGSKLLSILIASIGSATGYQVYYNNGSDIEIGFNLSATDHESILDTLLLPKDKNGNRYLNMAPNSTIKVQSIGSTLQAFAYGEDY